MYIFSEVQYRLLTILSVFKQILSFGDKLLFFNSYFNFSFGKGIYESKSHYFADEIYDIQMTLLFLHFAKESSEVCLQRNSNPEGTYVFREMGKERKHMSS